MQQDGKEAYHCDWKERSQEIESFKMKKMLKAKNTDKGVKICCKNPKLIRKSQSKDYSRVLTKKRKLRRTRRII